MSESLGIFNGTHILIATAIYSGYIFNPKYKMVHLEGK